MTNKNVRLNWLILLSFFLFVNLYEIFVEIVLNEGRNPSRLTAQMVASIGYITAFVIWYKTFLNALYAIITTGLVTLILSLLHPNNSEMYFSTIVIPFVGSLLLLAFCRAMFRIKTDYSWFERPRKSVPEEKEKEKEKNTKV